MCSCGRPASCSLLVHVYLSTTSCGAEFAAAAQMTFAVAQEVLVYIGTMAISLIDG